MSPEPRDRRSTAPTGDTPAFARAAGADAREMDRLATAIDDLFLDDDARLDDRTRAALAASLRRVIEAIERTIASHAARLLADAGSATMADALARRAVDVCTRLSQAGLLRHMDLMGELIARVREELIGAALVPIERRKTGASLLARLADCPDPVIATAASRLLVAESRRRSGAGGSELPADLYQRLVWWVAAGLRDALAPGGDAALDRALAEAARRALAAHDEGDTLEMAAMRLAAAIDARTAERGDLMVEALGDGRLPLFTAVVAHASGLGYADARAIVLDPDGDRLWLALHARGVNAVSLARIGWMLAEADPRRDADALADALDAVKALAPDHAATALDPMRLPTDFRAALRALAGRRR